MTSACMYEAVLMTESHDKLCYLCVVVVLLRKYLYGHVILSAGELLHARWRSSAAYVDCC